MNHAGDNVNGAGPPVGASKLDGGTDVRSAGRTSVGARRAAVNPGKRDQRFELRLTSEEAVALRDRAANQGWSVARLLTVSALEAPPTTSASQKRVEVEALLELRRLLANATANLNQLARHANTSGELPTAGLIDRVLADVSETTARVRRTVEERR